MQNFFLIISVSLMLVSCEKDSNSDKFMIGYSFINESDFRRLLVEIETRTYFPVEDTSIIKIQRFEMAQPDTFSMCVTNDPNLLGYKGCRKHYNFTIRIFEDIPGGGTYFSYMNYRLDTLQEITWQPISNREEGISVFHWPDDTLRWFKLLEYHERLDK